MIANKVMKGTFVAWLLFLIAVTTGCQSASGVSTSLLKDRDMVFRRIAVMPFQQVSPEVVATYGVQSSLPATILKTDNETTSPERFLQDLFIQSMAGNPQFDLVSPDRVGGIYDGVNAGSLKVTMIEALKATGRELDADGIVVGYLFRWRERRGLSIAIGKDWGTIIPWRNRLRFSLNSISTALRTEVWSGRGFSTRPRSRSWKMFWGPLTS